MTNIRTSGFDNPAQLQEHLSELEDDAEEHESIYQSDLQYQIFELRHEVRQLRRALVETRTRLPERTKEKRDDQFWFRFAAFVPAAFVLTAVRYFRVGPAGAAIASRIRRTIR